MSIWDEFETSKLQFFDIDKDGPIPNEMPDNMTSILYQEADALEDRILFEETLKEKVHCSKAPIAR